MAQVLTEKDHILADDGHLSNKAKRFVTTNWRYSETLLPHLILLLLLLLAFVLRIYALEGQSMWSDEGLSLYRARQEPADIFNGLIIIDGVETHDTNPPFYFFLLHLLRNAAGETVFALRYSGVLAGVLAVPFIYVLGTAVYGRRVGLVGALLMAISPFHVWQSQVLRNYSLLLTLNLGSIYGLFRYVLARSRKRLCTLAYPLACSRFIGHLYTLLWLFRFRFWTVCVIGRINRRQGLESLVRHRDYLDIFGRLQPLFFCRLSLLLSIASVQDSRWTFTPSVCRRS